MNKLLLALASLLLSTLTFAAGPVDGPVVIPTKFILTQLLNFVIMLGLLAYFLKGPAKTFFAARSKEYNDKLAESQKTLTAAQEKLDHINGSISKFKDTKESSLKRAETDASELKTKMVSEAQATATRMDLDVKNKISIELEHAKSGLMSELLDRSVDSAKVKMKSEIQPSDYQRLKGEFVDKVQVVGAQ